MSYAKNSKPASNPDTKPAPAPAPRHVRDIPLEDRLPEEFKPLYLWWKANGNYAVITLCVVCALVAGHRWHQRGRDRASAEIGQAFRNTPGKAADRADALEAVTRQHGASTAGKHAHLLLGKAYFDAERYDDALAAYRHYISKAPSKDFLPIALMGEAQSLEALNQPADAQRAYEAFIAKHAADHYLRPEAEMGRARCILLQGDKAAALLALEETEARYGATDWAQRIEAMRGVIERYVPRAPRKRLTLSERLGMGGLENEQPFQIVSPVVGIPSVNEEEAEEVEGENNGAADDGEENAEAETTPDEE